MAPQPQYAFERLRPGYARLWAAMTVIKTAEAIAQAKHVIANKARYKAVQQAARVPWFVVGALHMREISGKFTGWLHNGDPMHRDGAPVQTFHVPAHRPPDPNVSWEQGAFDALVTCERLNELADWCPELVAYAAEKFNGFGYRHPARNIPSPYLWGGTSVQQRGKFVADREYDASEMDPQLGVMAVLKTIMAIDPEARFEETAEVPADAPMAPVHATDPAEDAPMAPVHATDPAEDAPPPLSPKAHDTETAVTTGWLARSRTIWGNVVGYVTSIGVAIGHFFDKLDNPYRLAAFVAVLAVLTLAAWAVLTGRINAQKLVAHLAPDDTQGRG
jgi:lysozyme family protein